MKSKHLIVVLLAALCSLASFAPYVAGNTGLVFVEPEVQRTGDAAQGYNYLTTGNYLRSGLPYELFIKARGTSQTNYLHRTGRNATVEHGYNVVAGADSIHMVVPTCLQCHATTFEGQFVLGLGNAQADFTTMSKQESKVAMLKMLQVTAPAKYAAAAPFIKSLQATGSAIETEVRGVNPADKLAAVLAAHRDPVTLRWTDKPLIDIPTETIPTDVPAWWLLKKKNAMFYTGFGRGDFTRFLMMSNLLTVSDTAEAADVRSHFGDVLAYIYSLQPPPYPRAVNPELAMRGRDVFDRQCSGCHGTYGEGGTYPNLLVPGNIINTDSALYLANQQASPFLAWFTKSWFAQGENPARLVPFAGYIAPPLDGVWITAPYLHNGSVPTIEAVLCSKLRPAYWSRNFDSSQYDYDHLGWQYVQHQQPDGKNVYNTTLKGYGNYGHYFGDALSEQERKAVMEYLKTL